MSLFLHLHTKFLKHLDPVVKFMMTPVRLSEIEFLQLSHIFEYCKKRVSPLGFFSLKNAPIGMGGPNHWTLLWIYGDGLK